MKNLVCKFAILTLATTVFSGCAGLAFSASRQVGDGKGYIEVNGDVVSIGYKGKLPIPKSLAK